MKPVSGTICPSRSPRLRFSPIFLSMSVRRPATGALTTRSSSLARVIFRLSVRLASWAWICGSWRRRSASWRALLAACKGRRQLVVIQLVMDHLTGLAGDQAGVGQVVAPRRRAGQAGDVVVDVGGGLLIGQTAVLQLFLVGLQLGDGLDQPALAVQHVQLQAGVTKLQQRLPGLDHVPGLGVHLLNLPALQGVQIDDVVRRDLAAQGGEVVEGPLFHRVDRDLGRRHPHAALTAAEEGVTGEAGQEQAGKDRPADGYAPHGPPGPLHLADPCPCSCGRSPSPSVCGEQAREGEVV